MTDNVIGCFMVLYERWLEDFKQDMEDYYSDKRRVKKRFKFEPKI